MFQFPKKTKYMETIQSLLEYHVWGDIFEEDKTFDKDQSSLRGNLKIIKATSSKVKIKFV